MTAAGPPGGGGTGSGVGSRGEWPEGATPPRPLGLSGEEEADEKKQRPQSPLSTPSHHFNPRPRQHLVLPGPHPDVSHESGGPERDGRADAVGGGPRPRGPEPPRARRRRGARAPSACKVVSCDAARGSGAAAAAVAGALCGGGCGRARALCAGEAAGARTGDPRGAGRWFVPHGVRGRADPRADPPRRALGGPGSEDGNPVFSPPGVRERAKDNVCLLFSRGVGTARTYSYLDNFLLRRPKLPREISITVAGEFRFREVLWEV